jgi:uncharacterized low-complexity protein
LFLLARINAVARHVDKVIVATVAKVIVALGFGNGAQPGSGRIAARNLARGDSRARRLGAIGRQTGADGGKGLALALVAVLIGRAMVANVALGNALGIVIPLQRLEIGRRHGRPLDIVVARRGRNSALDLGILAELRFDGFGNRDAVARKGIGAIDIEINKATIPLISARRHHNTFRCFKIAPFKDLSHLDDVAGRIVARSSARLEFFRNDTAKDGVRAGQGILGRGKFGASARGDKGGKQGKEEECGAEKSRSNHGVGDVGGDVFERSMKVLFGSLVWFL